MNVSFHRSKQPVFFILYSKGIFTTFAFYFPKMKKWSFYIILFCVLVACNQGVMKKPNPFIEQEKMEEILYQLTILNAAKNTNHYAFEEHYIDVNAIIYKQNGIDSTQLAQNIIYYSSQPKKYHQMLLKIEKRIKIEDSLAMLEYRKSDSLKLEEQKDIEKPLDTLNIDFQ